MSTNETAVQTLEGLGVLVTRATHQADHLCGLIAARGGHVFKLPVLAIVPPCDNDALANIHNRLPEYDLAIFVSANAVRMAFPDIAPVAGWPRHLKIAAIGKQTAAAINAAGLTVDIVPETQFTSEALLSVDDMQDIAGRKVLIVRGEGGREYLATALTERGAHVDYAEVYQRALPEVDTHPVLDAWAQGRLHAATVASRQSLDNLHQLLAETGQRYLADTLLVVSNPRTAEYAAELGYTRIIVADDASDEAMVEALERWALSR